MSFEKLSELDFLLPKVLCNVAEDGLHECRRVCKKWKHACDSLPVKLNNRSSTLAQLHWAVENFSRITSVCVDLWGCALRETTSKDVSAVLASLPYLETLHLQVLSQMSLSSWELLFGRIGRLRALWITFETEHMNSVWIALGQLTNLLELRICVHALSDSITKPLTQLTNIQHLTINWRHFETENHQPSFPSLTGLAHLELNAADGDRCVSFSEDHLYELLNGYTSTLRRLDMSTLLISRSQFSWSFLVHFGRLESLRMPSVCYTGSDLLLTLKELKGLTHLHLNQGKDAGRQILTVDEITALQQLRDLSFQTPPYDCKPSLQFSTPKSLTRLTRLALGGSVICSVLELPHAIMQLSLECFARESSMRVDSLLALSGLERLELSRVYTEASVWVLPMLTKLTWLCIDWTCPAIEGILLVLSSLPSLSILRMTCVGYNPPGMSTARQLNQLTQLRCLCLDWHFALNPCSYIEKGCLMHLQYLQSYYIRLCERDKAELLSKLPCLRRYWNRSMNAEDLFKF